jgi:hypothetical protein
MPSRNEQQERPIVTAVLTTGVARISHGIRESEDLIDEILTLDHDDWETILSVGDVEFHQTKEEGPFPNHKMIVSVKPPQGYAALSYVDNDDPNMTAANSYSSRRPLPDIYLVYSGATGAVFPRSAAIPIPDAREALHEWLQSRRRPTCIEWRPFDVHS